MAELSFATQADSEEIGWFDDGAASWGPRWRPTILVLKTKAEQPSAFRFSSCKKARIDMRNQNTLKVSNF